MNILDQLAEYSRLRVAEDKKKISLEEMKNIAIQTKNEKLCDFAFEKALKKDGLSFICECKKASPSKGLIEPDFRYLEIAREYEAAGADCISVLTEPKWFLGSDEYLKEIAKTVSIPCIRKDFTVDEYQIYQAKTLGAAAVLLICSILSEVQLGEYIKICDSLGISALVEIHNEKEAGMAVRAGARIIGVNNRNLKDFTVDTANSRKLRDLILDDIIFVSESGVKSTDDIRAIREIGADAVLIGETLMRADDKKAKLDELRLSYLQGFKNICNYSVQKTKYLQIYIRRENIMTNPNGRFGIHGGQYIPETLMNAVKELEEAYNYYKNDHEFNRELTELLNDYAGRPSRLYYAEKMTKDLGGAKIYLKREDLNHTGAHKINNVLGQALLAKKMGKTRLIAETGAGQHGVATATAAALMGMECVVFMGEEDTKRQALNVYRMRLLGAEVIPVTSGTATLKDAVSEAMREWTKRISDTHYCSYGTTSVPYHRKRFPGGHLKGNQGADA